MAYLSQHALDQFGFQSLGENVRISTLASIYNPHLIRLGDNVRIDDFTVVSASEEPFSIGSFVHISTHCILIGRSALTMKDYSGLSGRVSIYTSSDDYSGEFMTNPTIPEKFTNVVSAPVVLGEHVIVGAGSVILPGVTVGIGSAISSLALVTKDVPDHAIAAGIPARKIKSRSKSLIDLGRQMGS